MLRKPLGGRGREWATESLKLLEAMLELDDSRNFREPLDPLKYPEYYSMTKTPIDLSKVMLKFHGGCYTTMEEFASDMREMFDNYKKFFSDPSSERYSQVHRLSWWFEGEFNRIKQKWGKDVPRPVSRAGCQIAPKKTEAAPKRYNFGRASGGGRKRTTLDERIRMLRECNRVSEHATRKALDANASLHAPTTEAQDNNTNIILQIKHGTCRIVPGKDGPVTTTTSKNNSPSATVSKPGRDSPAAPVVVNDSPPTFVSSSESGGGRQRCHAGHPRKRGLGGPNDPGPPRRIPRFMNNQGNSPGNVFRSAHVGMMLKVETNNIWFGASRYKPMDPVTLTEEGFQIPIRHNDQDIVFSIKSEAIIRCAANFSRARKHTLFLFVLPSCTAELHRVFGNDFSSSNNMFVLFLRPLMQSEISQMIHIFWNMSKNSMFGQLFSEVDQRSALALLANIKPAILKRLPDGMRRGGRGWFGMGRGCRMPWPMHPPGMMAAEHGFMGPGMGMHHPGMLGGGPGMHPPFMPFGGMFADPRSFGGAQEYADEEAAESSGDNERAKGRDKSPSKQDDSDMLFEDFGGVEEENGKDSGENMMDETQEILDESSDLEIVIPSDSEDEEKEKGSTKQQEHPKKEKVMKPENDEIVMTAEKISIKCPITQKVMKHPVKNKHCGHCYDREGIEEIIKHRGGKAKCPVPGCSNLTLLNSKDMLYDYNLWKHIQSQINPTNPNFAIK